MDIGDYRLTYTHNPPSALHGRFGGGWQWKVGFQASHNFRSVIVNLLVCYVRIQKLRAREVD